MVAFNYRSLGNCKRFFHEELSLLPIRKKAIFEKFALHALLEKRLEVAKKYLSPGYVPEISIHDLPTRYAETTPGKSYISFDRTFLSEIEPLLGNFDPKWIDMQARAALLMEAVTLHEMVHFGRFAGGLSPRGAREEAREELAARDFEKDAYKRVLNVNNLGLTQFMIKSATKRMQWRN